MWEFHRSALAARAKLKRQNRCRQAADPGATILESVAAVFRHIPIPQLQAGCSLAVTGQMALYVLCLPLHGTLSYLHPTLEYLCREYAGLGSPQARNKTLRNATPETAPVGAVGEELPSDAAPKHSSKANRMAQPYPHALANRE